MSNTFFNIFPNENFIDLCMYQFGYEQCDPGHSFGPATRNHYLFHYILSGTGTLMADNANGDTQTYSVKSGQGFMIFPGQINTYIADEQLPWEYMWIGFSGSEVTLILQDCGLMGNRPILDFENAPLLTDTLAHLIQQCEHKEENRYTLLGNLYQIFGCRTETHRESYTTVKNIYLRQALNYIQNNYMALRAYLWVKSVAEMPVKPLHC